MQEMLTCPILSKLPILVCLPPRPLRGRLGIWQPTSGRIQVTGKPSQSIVNRQFRRGHAGAIKAAESAGLKAEEGKIYQPTSVESANPRYEFSFEGKTYNHRWKTHSKGLSRLASASRFHTTTNSLRHVRYVEDFPVIPLTSVWTDTGAGSFLDEQVYVVQTITKIIQRCLLMTTDPGDLLVLDPTCGSGTTATVAKQWRWITNGTSRVALALARALRPA